METTSLTANPTVSPTTYPMTIGQLSVHRDVELVPADRLWEANLQPVVWDVRTPCTVEDVWQALGALAERHESLRTNYLFEADGSARQFIGAQDAAEVLARVDRGVADVEELPALLASKYQEALDIYHGIPWRAWVITADGVPTKVLLVVHHIAADGAAALIMQDDFHALLAGEPLDPPAGQPIAMALDQQGAGAFRLRAAQRYWRRTLEAAPRLPEAAVANAEMLGAVLQTGIPLELAHAGAEKLDVSMASVVLAAYYHAVRTVLGRSALLLMAMSANRFDPSMAGVVTSLTQWAPMLLDFDGTEPFAELAAKVNGKALNAFKNSICDPDYVVDVREEYFEKTDPPVDKGFSTNVILAPPGFAPAVEQEPHMVEFAPPARSFGPGFYFIVSGLERIDVAVRCNRPDVDQPTLAAILDVFQKTLLEVAGLPAMG
ncbi:condensation domain-containing protein [Catenulispora rubra]|uniref:condensation domain-containing protein n=1 Tax=Catenulispora rubra TaxID=280293 RepID=UPI0018925344|nr:condensation domain-containing protein [Catenulispora rubra]